MPEPLDPCENCAVPFGAHIENYCPDVRGDTWFERKLTAEERLARDLTDAKASLEIQRQTIRAHEQFIERTRQYLPKDVNPVTGLKYEVPDAPSSVDVLVKPLPLNHPLELDGYDELRKVLAAAVEQASRGKGKERHATEGEAFEDQQIVQEGRWLGTNHGQIFQARKKAMESTRLPPDRARTELLGAIVYLAAAVILLPEVSKR